MFGDEKSLTLPKIGMRKIKSLLAVALVFVIWQAVRLVAPFSLDLHPLFGYIYAVIDMRDSVKKTVLFGKQ